MELEPFDLPDAATVAGWSGSADESLMWCSRAEVTAEVVAGWSAEDGVVAYAMVDGGQLVAYGELWVDPDESEVELARLIVAPERRGRGDGRALVRALAGEAVRRYPAVFMRVHPDNARALRCYAGAGFTPVSAAEADEWNRAQPVAFVWLRLAAA
ncbi:MAG TPA: GNAT family N-acetyltransferase [Micromonosporaceae bacterium]|nr:GNAT family N-acetyltransferase [Micromonosporaceae bacterium]